MKHPAMGCFLATAEGQGSINTIVVLRGNSLIGDADVEQRHPILDGLQGKADEDQADS
jgi:hypothetical protein